MEFIPKKFKYKKEQKGVFFNKIHARNSFQRLNDGTIGLKSQSSGFITSQQLFTIKRYIRKALKKKGKLKINAFAFTPITKKSVGVRMGKGKGSVSHWVFKLKPGFLVCEIITHFKRLGLKILHLLKKRLSFLTRVIYF